MKKILYTTTAFVLCGGIVQANAACIATPSCTTMGYTSTSSCTNGIKCPFGEYWNCDLVNKITELEEKINQQEQENALNSCALGHIFYSDKSCSVFRQTVKRPIGVVVYTDGQGHGQVLALKSIGSYEWTPSDEYVDIPTLTNYSSALEASQDYDSCGNTEKIIAAGDKSKYPAAWAAHEYKTEGTSAGDWCLPAAGIITSYYNNKQQVNVGLTNAGGTQFTTSTYVWSSSESGKYGAWSSDFSSRYGLKNSDTSKFNSREVRPVLEF